MSLPYYKRWTIEKAFNNNKSDFKERKAWSSQKYALENQMRLMAMSYNLMRVLEEASKQDAPERIHPSDKKYDDALEKKQRSARKKGQFVNPLFFQARITRISSFTIRTAQSAIITGRSLVDVLRSLIRQLVPRRDLIEKH